MGRWYPRQLAGGLAHSGEPLRRMFVPSFRQNRVDPWWGHEGQAARRDRRRDQLVSLLAFVASLGAVGGAGLAWALRLGMLPITGI